MLQMQPDQQNPYNFILDEQAQKKSMVNFGGGSGGQNKIIKIVLFLLGVAVLLVIGIVLISSIGKTSNEDLLGVRAYQAEIYRVIELGQKDTSDLALKNDLASLQAALESDQTQLSALLKARSVNVPKETLASKKDSKIDSALETAKLNSTYDTTLRQAIDSLSGRYVTSIRTALSDTASANEKLLLETAGNNIVVYSNATN